VEFSVRYNDQTQRMTIWTDGVEVFAAGTVAGISFVKSKGSDQFSLTATGPDGAVKRFGRAAAAEEDDVVVDEQVASAIAEYLRPGAGDD
jgi:hypothetical protein